MTLTTERVRELFDYDPSTGHLVRRVRTGARAMKGAIAGSLDAHGYWQVEIDRRAYKAHWLVWLHVYGKWPEKKQIDHINGDRLDNRIENLREASNQENCHNTIKGWGVTGFRGVSFDKQSGRWCARITASGRKRHLGFFRTPQEASAAYLAAKSELHPFWAGALVHEGD